MAKISSSDHSERGVVRMGLVTASSAERESGVYSHAFASYEGW